MKNIAPLIALLVSWLSVPFAVADPSTVNIMPLGDSFTSGYSVPTFLSGYRDGLYSRLEASGYVLDFLGTQVDTQNPALLDPDHEGHGGFRIDQIASNVQGWLTAVGNPDVILLIIGTNDFTQNEDPAGAPNRLGNLITQISTLRPNAKILLGNLPLRTDSATLEADQSVYNSLIPGIVSDQVLLGHQVDFVDIHSSFDASGLSSDGVHPNSDGYDAIADVWAQAIMQILANGSFEVGELITATPFPQYQLNSWTVTGTPCSYPGNSVASATNGSRMALLNGGNDIFTDTLAQTFATTPGVTYRLQFDLGIIVAAGQAPRQQLLGVGVTAEGGGSLISQDVLQTGNEGPAQWTAHSILFTATTATTTLAFTDKSGTLAPGVADFSDLLLDHVRVNVLPPNSAPVALAQSLNLNEDVPTPVTLTGSDVEGNALTFTVTAQPLHGTLSGTAPTLTYTPAANYNGPDSFDFTVNDGTVDSAPATVSITVAPVNDAPLALAQSLNLDEDVPTPVTLTGSDVEGSALTFTVTEQPLHGTLSGTSPNLTYTPAANYNGPDSFAFTANDGTVDSAPATVTLTVAPLNDAPLADDDSYGTAWNTALVVAAPGVLDGDTDADLQPLTAVPVTGPANGSLILNPDGGFTYTPNSGFAGTDSFTYRANDGLLDSNLATVSIVVNPPGPLANGSFELGALISTTPFTRYHLDNWTVAGELTGFPGNAIASATDGSRVALFNGGSDTFTGALSQTIATTPGVIYRLQFDHGIVAAAGQAPRQQLLGVAVTAEGGGSLLSQDLPLTANEGPAQWTAKSILFTATTATTTLAFTDKSGTLAPGVADFSDLLLDHVRVEVAPPNSAPVALAQSLNLNEDVPTPVTLTGSDVDGNALTFTVTAQPLHGTLSGTAPTLTYTPAANYNGPDSFDFTVNDGTVDSAPATVSITVAPVNDAPLALAQSLNLDEDVPTPVTLTGSDVEGSALTFTVTEQPLHGTLSGTSPNLTYTPAANYNGPDSFAFTANDGTVDSAPATVTLTVAPLNDAPLADDDSYGTAWNTALVVAAPGVLDGDTDADLQPLTAVPVTGPANGSLILNPDGGFTYTPNSGFAGTDSFTYRANDGLLDSNLATVSIVVNPPGPLANGSFELGALISTTPFTRYHLDNWTVAGELTGFPGNAIASATDGSRVALFNGGSDTFTGALSQTIATTPGVIYRLQFDHGIVAAAGQAPRQQLLGVAVTAEGGGSLLSQDLPLTANEGPAQWTAKSILFTATTATTTLAFTDKSGTLAPGVADFSDLLLDHVRVEVAPPNSAPVALAQSLNLNEDVPTPVTLTGSDVDGNALTFTVTAQPLHGTLSGTAPTLTYTPAANYNGPDSFDFTVNDGTVDSAPATVSITVAPVNDAPLALAQSLNLDEDVPTPVTLTGSDVEGSALTFTVTEQPLHGTLSGTSPNLTYTPAANYNGPDSFAFTANDGTVDSAPATVTLTVAPLNDAPLADDDSYGTAWNTALVVAAPGVLDGDTDADLQPLTAVPVTGPANGSLILNPDGGFTYTPNSGFAGTDSFTYRANDGLLDSNLATVSIVVNPPGPLANGSFELGALISTTPFTRYHLDNWTVAGELTGFPGNAIASATDGSRVALFNGGSDTFTGALSQTIATTPGVIYRLQFDHGIVAAAGQAPRQQLLGVAVTAEGGGSLLSQDLPLTANEGPAQWTAKSILFTATTATTTLAFTDKSGTLAPGVADFSDLLLDHVRVEVAPPNSAPVALAQSLNLNEDVPTPVTLTGSDVDGNALTFTVTAQPLHGTLSGTAPTLTYTPAANYNGPDSFDFTVNDGTVDSAPATVSITVAPVNDAPLALAQSLNLDEDVPTPVTLTGSDVEGSALTFTVTEQPLHGTLSGTSPNLTYTPAANYNGPDSFAFTANDGTVDSAPATVTLTVAPLNDAPLADDDSYGTAWNTALVVAAPGVLDGDTDADLQPLTAVPVTGPANGSLILNPDGGFTYTPNSGFAGTDSFTYRANDGLLDSNLATVSIVVNPPGPLANGSFELGALISTTPFTRYHLDNWTVAGELTGFPGNAIASATDGSRVALFNGGSDTFTGALSQTIATTPGVIYRLQFDHGIVAAAGQAPRQQLLGVAVTAEGGGSLLSQDLPLTANEGPAQWTAKSILFTATTATTTLAFTDKSGTLAPGVADFSDLLLDHVRVEVAPPNSAPVALAQSLNLNEDVPTPVTLTGSDVDGNALTFTVTAQPLHGTLSGTAPTLTYTPAANYNGPDSFDFTVNDGTVDSAPATVSITVAPVADNVFAEWLAGFGMTGNPGEDPDEDSITNMVEYVIGGNPKDHSDVDLLPSITFVSGPNQILAAGDYLLFTYRRTQLAKDDPATTITVHWSEDLVGPWTAATGANGEVIVEVNDGAGDGVDLVHVYIPRPPSGRLFARLGVVIDTP